MTPYDIKDEIKKLRTELGEYLVMFTDLQRYKKLCREIQNKLRRRGIIWEDPMISKKEFTANQLIVELERQIDKLKLKIFDLQNYDLKKTDE